MNANPVQVTLTDAQCAEFRALDTQEAQARTHLEQIPVARLYAARAVLLQTHTADEIAGQHISIDPDAKTITLALKS